MKMVERVTAAKIYLNVPYAEKDAVKALGAKWDPFNKKWYVPAGVDISQFQKWHNPDLETNKDSHPKDKAIPVLAAKETKGTFTYPANNNFVAYDGDAPHWD
jgi:hypothetical protein